MRQASCRLATGAGWSVSRRSCDGMTEPDPYRGHIDGAAPDVVAFVEPGGHGTVLAELADRLPDAGRAHRNGRTSIFRLQCFGPFGVEAQRHIDVGGLDDPEAGEILLRLQ